MENELQKRLIEKLNKAANLINSTASANYIVVGSKTAELLNDLDKIERIRKSRLKKLLRLKEIQTF